MNIFLIIYIIISIICIISSYFMIKKDNGLIKDFIKIAIMSIIPCINIVLLLFYIVIWYTNNLECTINEFLNKRL
jgi:hypothetical protein